MSTDSTRTISVISETIQGHTGKVGRPSKLTPETLERLVKALSDGLTIKQACLAAGIGETTLARWKDEHPGLVPQLEQARERARQDALATIKRAGDTDWRAKKAFLELSYPEYRQPTTKVEVNTSAQAGELQVICTEEQRRAMIEARQRFLLDNAKPQLEQKRLEPGKPIGATHCPEDPKIAKAREFEGGITADQAICGTDRLGRLGMTD
jgi:hypothetical protein